MQIGYALTGRRDGTDELMLQLLAPYAGQRHRAARLILLAGPPARPSCTPGPAQSHRPSLTALQVLRPVGCPASTRSRPTPTPLWHFRKPRLRREFAAPAAVE